MRNRIESMAKKGFRKFGLDVSYAGRDSDLYINCLAGALSVQKPLNIIQVGANDGKFGDPIYEFVKENKNYTNIVLIEPLENLLPYLKGNYDYHPSTEIFNNAIAEDKSGTSSIQLYRIKKDYWSDIDAGYGESWPDYRVPTGVTTSDKSKLINWASDKIPPELDPDEVIEEFNVDTIRPRTVLQKSTNIDKVHLLQVDTEGMDDKVVYSFFDEEIYPSIINIEKKHLSESRKDKFNHRLRDEGYRTYDYTSSERLALKNTKITNI